MSTTSVKPVKEQPPIADFPKPTEGFFRYFSQYMGLSSLAVAALPIPVAALRLIPVPDGQITVYCVYTSLFCVLLSSCIFYSRHQLANLFFGRHMFREHVFWRRRFKRLLLSGVPILLIASSFYLAMYYQGKELYKGSGESPLLFFVAMFLLAEAAFSLMATREYLQEILGLEDRGIIDRLKYEDSHLALVKFRSEPSDAEVFLSKEGQEYEMNTIGLTPISQRLEPGRYVATIQKGGLIWKTPFEIWRSEEKDFEAKLEPNRVVRMEASRKNCDFKFESMPSGAEVYLGPYSPGDTSQPTGLSGITPASFVLVSDSSYRVSIRMSGYRNWDRVISISDQQKSVVATLEQIGWFY